MNEKNQSNSFNEFILESFFVGGGVVSGSSLQHIAFSSSGTEV